MTRPDYFNRWRMNTARETLERLEKIKALVEAIDDQGIVLSQQNLRAATREVEGLCTYMETLKASALNTQWSVP